MAHDTSGWSCNFSADGTLCTLLPPFTSSRRFATAGPLAAPKAALNATSAAAQAFSPDATLHSSLLPLTIYPKLVLGLQASPQRPTAWRLSHGTLPQRPTAWPTDLCNEFHVGIRCGPCTPGRPPRQSYRSTPLGSPSVASLVKTALGIMDVIQLGATWKEVL
eukprot:CAMPEP_0203755902 /NCGR_PEP_ID=MMETSP0098-20131031/9250_1 /ASSEMBLY_ACC=CAM_ASM_000208 /TAXON_ID=96639 /ORGANISM=" , Strain NY0313808BC1" /LENGTH=162 /DNA_ID=CAMNT_0050647531 /DNA_START=796 /DNA_END=1281 /DNA_ORIENTATION=+